MKKKRRTGATEVSQENNNLSFLLLAYPLILCKVINQYKASSVGKFWTR
jgi:hypothetical protein